MHRSFFIVGPLVLIASFTIPIQAQDAPDPDAASSELRPVIQRYRADLEDIERTYPIRISDTRQARLRRFFDEQQAALVQIDFDKLSQDGRIDYLLLRNHIERQRSEVARTARETAEIAPLIPFYPAIVTLEENRRKMLPLDAAKAGETLGGLAKAIDEARALNAGAKVKPAVANRAAARLGELHSNLRQWHTFYNGYDPLFTWWADDPYKKVDQALDSYTRFLREQLAGIASGGREPVIGDPAGRQALVDDLAYNMIPYTPEELLTLAHKEYAWCEKEMIKASRELKYGDDWRKALEYVKTKYVEPGKQPELVRQLAQEAIDYVTQRDLVTVPPLAREDWWEEMLSPQRQATAPFFLGGDLILVAFPTNTMTQEQKLMSMRGNNIYFARSTVFHELIPGHHLQGFMTERYRAYRSVFQTPFWTEGNAFYWEMLLWDMGFARTPEDRIGMLFWHMHRAARIIFSISFHLEKMTAEECVDFLVDQVGFERENAEAEVRRSFDGSYEPIYQCAYMLGALQFHELHKEMVDSGKMTNRAFHDAILKDGRIPVELIRADFTGQKLTRDFQSSWRFYDLTAPVN
jgi:uncharacterized protein (DUF885 family)